jgi:hypothetical protein
VSAREVFGGEPVIEFDRARDRRSFLRWAAILGVGGSLAAVAGNPFASAQGADDVEILNYALTLEYLERDFFGRGLRAGILSGRDEEIVQEIGEHESQHVATLSQAVRDLGGTPVDEPRLRYPAGVFGDRATWLDTASKLEELAVKAYHGQVTNIGDAGLLGAAASLAGAESRHAAILADLSGGNPFPAPLEQHLNQSRVLMAARPFFKS